MRRTLFLPLCLLMALTLGACETAGFLGQAAVGQADLLLRAKPVDQVIADPDTDADTAARLRLAQKIKAYAQTRLAMTPGSQYSRYADLERDAAVYTVIAAYPLALKTKDFCFPVVGCVPYRGYFNEAGAKREAARMQAAGFDVYSGGVDAYSTLGYLPDPLLNTFLDDGDLRLIELIFHELSHATVFIPGDTAFNESFATAVQQLATRQWLQENRGAKSVAAYERLLRARLKFDGLIADARTDLANVYAGKGSANARLRAKRAAIGRLQNRYRRLKPSLNGISFDRFFLSDDLNNAKILAVGLYGENVPHFIRLFERERRNWPRFYAAVKRLGALPPAERQRALKDI